MKHVITTSLFILTMSGAFSAQAGTACPQPVDKHIGNGLTYSKTSQQQPGNPRNDKSEQLASPYFQ